MWWSLRPCNTTYTIAYSHPVRSTPAAPHPHKHTRRERGGRVDQAHRRTADLQSREKDTGRAGWARAAGGRAACQLAAQPTDRPSGYWSRSHALSPAYPAVLKSLNMATRWQPPTPPPPLPPAGGQSNQPPVQCIIDNSRAGVTSAGPTVNLVLCDWPMSSCHRWAKSSCEIMSSFTYACAMKIMFPKRLVTSNFQPSEFEYCSPISEVVDFHYEAANKCVSCLERIARTLVQSILDQSVASKAVCSPSCQLQGWGRGRSRPTLERRRGKESIPEIQRLIHRKLRIFMPQQATCYVWLRRNFRVRFSS